MKTEELKTTVILVRHGQSEGNLKNVFLGHTDLPLTPLGLRQAEAGAEYVASHYKVDKIIASDLIRAYQTASTFANRLGLPIEKNPAFREIYAGDWENTPFADLKVKYPETYGIWLSNLGFACPDNGESVRDLYDRINNALNRVIAENPGKTVLIGTHATPIRSIHCRIVKGDPTKMQEVPWFSNASLTVLSYENGKLTEVLSGFDGHLGETRTMLPANV